MQFTLGEVVIDPVPAAAREFYEYVVRLPFHITRAGVTLTNWITDYLEIEDESGNLTFAGVGSITDGWTVYRCWTPAAPRRLWRLKANFGMTVDVPATNLLTVNLPAYSLVPLTTNFQGVPLQFRSEGGRAPWVGGELLTNRSDVRLDLISINGADPTHRSGNWDTRSFRRSLRGPPDFSPPPAGSTVILTVAVQKNIPVTFTVRPRLTTTSAAAKP